MSKIEDKVIKKINDRAALGKNKYNTTMERTDLGFLEWLNHLQEELLDAAIYVEKLKEESNLEIEIQMDAIKQFSEEESDRRMKHIGQNGNTGEHYGNI